MDQVCRRITKHQQDVRHALVPINERGGYHFDTEKQFRRYEKLICQARDGFLAMWPGETLNGKEYVNAVLLYLEELWEQAGHTRDIIGQLTTETGRLYELMDPDLENGPHMDMGQMAGERLVGIMEEA
jgi:hypothetical protein